MKLSKFWGLLLVFAMIFVFVSCDNGTTPQVPENPDAPSESPENPNTPPVDTDGEDDKEDEKTQEPTTTERKLIWSCKLNNYRNFSELKNLSVRPIKLEKAHCILRESTRIYTLGKTEWRLFEL